MPSPDHPTTLTSSTLPEPPSGVGAADLTTDSTDPQELRALLERARERLAFYESFDRIIGENIRRSGELMVETVALREQAHALAEQSAKDRVAFEATRQADRDRYRSLVQTALDDVASMQPVIDSLVQKLQRTIATIDDTPESPELSKIGIPEVPESDDTATDSVSTPSEAPVPTDNDNDVAFTSQDSASPTIEEKQPEPTPPIDTAIPSAEPTAHDPRTIQVLAHRVPNAKTAISLQKMLRTLDIVTNVDAREFANGELRLAVSANSQLPDDALVSWLASNKGELESNTANVVEIQFGE